MSKFVPFSTYWDKKTTIHTSRGDFNCYSTNVSKTDFVLLCVHGAGHSGLSFSLLAEQLRDTCPVFAPDLKCHGETPGDPSKDLSLENLSQDVIEIAKCVKPENSKLLILGHSFGGSIATKASYVLKPKGLFVIDTIEGIAVAAMPGMRSILRSRPSSFKTEDAAIGYISSSGEMSSRKSASVSAAGRLHLEGGEYRWITDLLPSESEWVSWFRGFADAFIKAPTYKVLMLPTIDKLDTPFTIGHMSGKFQLEIIHGTNHCMHEDRPQDVAVIIKNFIERMSQVIPKWPSLS